MVGWKDAVLVGEKDDDRRSKKDLVSGFEFLRATPPKRYDFKEQVSH